ncbi:alpha-xylosidase [Exilibacterium tricleocarpae]|uniref:Alpha-xylosidase n=1 Tax=Exilibacterium tricleocarpae TaxID=2591008 RepID=A0A545SS44_9GAMM|nr:alpha-xylosidase [Exilibacterium tricleocarpae]TQV67736.1 alpha-xylosidase [Exilibacterium tricleocarpae]
MNAFDPLSPNWGRIDQLAIAGPAEQRGEVLVLPTSAGPLTVSLHAFGARLRFGERSTGDYGLLVDEPVAAPLTVAVDTGVTEVSAAGFTLRIEHRPFAFELRRGDKRVQSSPTDAHFVRRFRLPPVARLEDGWFMSLELDTGEPVYGLGEKWGRLDKRGQLIESYNRDALGVNGEASYKNTPFAWSPAGWGLLVHTPAPVTHGVGFAPWSQRAYGLYVEEPQLDLFLFAGTDGAEIIGHYTELTGRAPVPPLWSLGVILSKAYYVDAEELLDTARQVREREMPCDVITLDGRAWLDTDTRFAFEWDAARYPQPKQVLDELKALNFKVCVWEYPLVSVQHPLFDEMAAKGWLLTDSETGAAYRYQWDSEPFGDVLTPLPISGLVDFTHPDAYAFWRDRHQSLFEVGVDMIKADFGEQVEDDTIQAANGDRGRQLHNAYTLLYNRCVYEAAERYCGSGAFLFSRSSWTGCQRYPSQWGGDPQADWGGLAASLRGGLSWGLSGAPFYATDVGGFYGDQRDAVLYLRWAQAAVFSAHMRLHGIGQREPWSYTHETFGAAAAAAAMQALQLRYRLLPYLQEVVRQASATGLPCQRAMALAFPQERAAWGFEEQFMFGDKMLVAPCLRADGEVEVYLPRGQWRRFPDRQPFAGGRSYHLALALEEYAVFVREGDRVPLGPDVLHTEALGGRVKVERYWCAGDDTSNAGS